MNDPSQGSVATNVICVGIFNNHITTNLLPRC